MAPSSVEPIGFPDASQRLDAIQAQAKPPRIKFFMSVEHVLLLEGVRSQGFFDVKGLSWDVSRLNDGHTTSLCLSITYSCPDSRQSTNATA